MRPESDAVSGRAPSSGGKGEGTHPTPGGGITAAGGGTVPLAGSTRHPEGSAGLTERWESTGPVASLYGNVPLSEGGGVRADSWGWRHSGRKGWALRDVTLTIRPGERVLLAGASGSGKSTLMSALAGVMDPEEGEAEGTLTVDGLDPASAKLRGSAGLVQQDPDSQIVMARIGDEVAFGLENAAVPQEQIWPRVRQALDDVGLDLPLEHPTAELSGGQKQRLALACALAMRPEMLLLDEPTANLDADGSRDLRRVVRDVVGATGATLVIIEHNLERWVDQVDRIVVLRRGRVIADGPVEQVLAQQASQLREDGVWVPGESTEELLASAAAREGLADWIAVAEAGAANRDGESSVGAGTSVRGVPGYEGSAPVDALVGQPDWTHAKPSPATHDRKDEGSNSADTRVGQPDWTHAKPSPATHDRRDEGSDSVDALKQEPGGTPAGAAGHSLGATHLGGPDLLGCRELAIGYSRERPAVNSGISVGFGQGGVTSIVGGNGVGKTTLALTVAGLLEPLSGEVFTSPSLRGPRIKEPDPNRWSGPELLGRISMVFQEPAYQFLCNTVEEELALGPKLMNPGADPTAEVDRFLRVLRLDHLRKAHPLSLSGGEKRRLSVATALISAPRVLILDEPTFGQDRNTWAALVILLRQVAAAGTAVVSITHDRRFVDAMGGQVIELLPADTPTGPDEAGSAGVRGGGSSPPPPNRTHAVQAPVVEQRGLIDRVNPVVQLIGLVILTMPLIATIDIVSAAVALGAEILLLPVLGMSPRQIISRIWPLLVATPFAVISMLLYGAPGGTVYWSLGPAVISENSIQLALAIGLRVLAVGLPAILVLSRIDGTAMADSLTQVLHLPARLVLSALAGTRMVTLMLSDWQALARARRSRGLGSGNRFTAFFRGSFALLAFAIRRAGTLSLTMEARGFGAKRPRTNARTSTLSSADLVMLVVCAAISGGALAAAVWAGTFRWFGI